MDCTARARTWVLVMLVLLTGTLAACGGGTEAVPEPQATAPAESPLVGTSWRLVSLNGREVLPGTTATAVFGETDNLGGHAGCNEFSATYQTEDTAISITSVVPSSVVCDQLAEIMAQEEIYLALLENAAKFQVQGNQLELSTVDDSAVAILIAAPPAPLEGTEWQLYAANDLQGAVVDPLPDSRITALFDGDGNLSGSSGCNDYTATYEIDGNALVIGTIASTRMMCSEPEGIMDQETAYLSLLESTASYEILADLLALGNANGVRVLLFSAAQGGE